jgi:predicted alpha/beta hydrolase family esterase
MRVLILHGLHGSGSNHWQTWLANELRSAGVDVAYPDLPDPSAPQLEPWLAALALERGPRDVVVCHSLACCLWLHHRARGGARADRVLMVAPPCRDDIPEIAPFFPVPLERELVPEAHIWCSDDDPYCPAGAVTTFAEPLGVAHDLFAGGGHLNPDAGYGPWPLAAEWVYGAKNGVET